MGQFFAFAVLAAGLLLTAPVTAATTTGGAPSLDQSVPAGGFGLSHSFYSGSNLGDPLAGGFLGTLDEDLRLDRAAQAGDPRVYALLVDGTYDFNYDFGTDLPLHPYVLGGLGMATFDRGEVGMANLAPSAGSDTVPLFRLGGGVTYRLGPQWDLSLDYKAGFAGSGGDQMFTNRGGQQPMDLHMLNMGMRYQF